MNTILTTLKQELEVKCDAYVSAFNAHEKNSKLKLLKADAANAVKAYNLAAEKIMYREWATDGDPIRTAIRTLKANRGMKATYKVNDDTEMMSVSYKDADIRISLPMMQYVLGVNVFNKPDWFAKCEKLMFMYAGYLAEMLGMDKFECSISDIGKQFSFSSDVDVYSAEGIQNALQQVFDSILYIENPDVPGTNVITARSKVVNGNKVIPAWVYISNALTAYDKSSDDLKLGNTGFFSYLIAVAMNKILTNGTFKLIADEQFKIEEEKEEEKEEEVISAK